MNLKDRIVRRGGVAVIAGILVLAGVLFLNWYYVSASRASIHAISEDATSKEECPTRSRYLAAVVKLERHRERFGFVRHPKLMGDVAAIEDLRNQCAAEGIVHRMTSNYVGLVSNVYVCPGDPVAMNQKLVEIEKWNFPSGDKPPKLPLKQVQLSSREGIVGQLFARRGGFVDEGARLLDLVLTDRMATNKSEVRTPTSVGVSRDDF